MDTSPLVSVIIVNWNTRELLLQCIQSIEKSAEAYRCPPCEVIVVDNASSDGSAEALRREFPHVKLIEAGGNLGFAAGNNLGIRHATGEFVLFLNPDTVVEKDAVRGMRDFLMENPDAGAVGCELVNPDGSPQESYWTDFPNLRWLTGHAFYLNKIKRRLGHSDAKPTGPTRVAHLLGACIMARTDTIRQLGGFDESYFMYLEETDLCYRLRKQGLEIYFLPGPRVTHHGQQSSNQAAEWTNSHLYLNTYKFIREHQATTTVSSWLLRGILVMSVALRLTLWSARFVTGLRDRELARKMLSGYLRSLIAICRVRC